jgi:hypothetical protein
MMTDVLR